MVIMNRSESINELSSALALAQTNMFIAHKNKANPFFKSKYADFLSLVEVSRPHLAKNGLSVVQTINDDANDSYLLTYLLHSSGQFIFSKKRITPLKADIQSYSSYVSYCKRIAYAAICGVVTSGEDDDGERAMQAHRQSIKNYTAPETTITADQLEHLRQELESEPELTKSILKAFNIEEMEELPKKHFMSIINRIKEVKNLSQQ